MKCRPLGGSNIVVLTLPNERKSIFSTRDRDFFRVHIHSSDHDFFTVHTHFSDLAQRRVHTHFSDLAQRRDLSVNRLFPYQSLQR